MPSAAKVSLREEYAELLAERPDFILTRYQGLSVADLDALRAQLREKGIVYQVVKNNIFRLALEESGKVKDFPYDATFHGPIGVAFAAEDMPSAAKVLKNFAKTNDKMSVMAGVLENTFYDDKGVEAIANLPSKEQILATLAAALNGPATKTAGLMNNIMASLARAIKAVGEKNG